MKQTLLFIALRINSLGSKTKVELCACGKEKIESTKRHKPPPPSPQTIGKIHNINVKLLQNNCSNILENSSLEN